MTVAGTTEPSSANSCVMPTFLPMIAVTICSAPELVAWLGCELTRQLPLRYRYFVFFTEGLDLDVDAGR